MDDMLAYDFSMWEACTKIFIPKLIKVVGLGGLGVTCLPRDPRFAGSNPAEDINILSTSPLESEISGSLKNLKSEKNTHLRKILSAYSCTSNTLVPIQLAHEVMDLSPITLPVIENKCS